MTLHEAGDFGIRRDYFRYSLITIEPGKKLRLLSRIRLANLTAAGSQEIRVWGGVSIGTAATTAPES